ncbi:helix-turn-helix domain-containing protein [Streptococcus mitis]|mgnify:FL=1|jgi:XRE family transcriptional regulator|uniref:helix-turn-helix transcriptional regulator n=1 Tax=Streptococcus mitis TaxID=28037 RepID=UPI001C4EA1F9
MKNRIKLLRQKQGKTQKELADEIGVKKLTISRWENAEDVSLKQDKAQQLADYFGVSVGYLLGYDEADQMNNLVNNELENLTQKLNQYREQYDVLKKVLSDKLQYLDKTLREDEFQREDELTTLLAIKALVGNVDRIVEIILSTKENFYEFEKLKMAIQNTTATVENNDDKLNNIEN